MYRLFVGFRPPKHIRSLLVDAMGGIAGARWQSDEQLHVTLRFIGEVDGAATDDIAASLVTLRETAFDMSIAGIGCFDRRGRIHTIWAGVTPVEPITALHRKVDHAVVRVGRPPDVRRFIPHVTLARLNAGGLTVRPFLSSNADLRTPCFRVDEVELFESILGSEGARYHAIARYPLTDPR